MTTVYAVTIEQPRALAGGLYVELRCETCDDVHRIALDPEQLDAIRSVMERSLIRGRLRLTELHGAELLNAAAGDIIAALVWQLTHTTSHDEDARRAPRAVPS